MPTQTRALTVMPRRTVARYLDEEDSYVPEVRRTDDLREIKARLALLERAQTTSNLPVVATARHEDAPVVVQQPREGFLRGILRRMAD